MEEFCHAPPAEIDRGGLLGNRAPSGSKAPHESMRPTPGAGSGSRQGPRTRRENDNLDMHPLILALALAAVSPAPAQTGPGGLEPNRFDLPVSQILTPAGRQVQLPGMRPQAIALSPDGSLLITSGKTHDLVVLDPQMRAILQH